MKAGRLAGGVASIVQGVSEGTTGAGMMTGGTVVCITLVGCVATAVAVPAGAVLTAHGAAVASAGAVGVFDNVVNLISDGTGGSNSRDFTRLSKGEIKQLTRAGYHPHDLKPQKHGSRYDIFKDEYGDLYVMPKDGSGPGDPLGININDLWD